MSTNCDIDEPSEHVDVRLNITTSFVLTLGVYSGPLTKAIVAENLANFLRDDLTGLLMDAIDKIEIVGVLIDDEEQVLI